MEIFFFVLAVILFAVFAPLFGSDSRHLDDDSWARDGLWSRAPRA